MATTTTTTTTTTPATKETQELKAKRNLPAFNIKQQITVLLELNYKEGKKT
jgi:hypothetical protein